MKKLILILIMSMFLITLVGAEVQSLPTQRRGNCVELVQSHPNITSINVTKISYPSNCDYPVNYTVIPMSSDNGFNYYYSFCNTTCVGDYVITTCGDGDGIIDCMDYDFNVNITGREFTQAQGILYIIMFLGLMIIWGITFYGATIFPWKNPRDDGDNVISINNIKYLKIVLWVFVYLEFMFIVSILKNLSLIFLQNEGTYYFFNMIFWFMLIGLIPFFPLLIFFTVVIWLSDKEVLKKITRGVFVNE